MRTFKPVQALYFAAYPQKTESITQLEQLIEEIADKYKMLAKTLLLI